MSFAIDNDYLKERLLKLLKIHSPTGYTDPIVREVCEELSDLGIDYEITRRGAIRATLRGEHQHPTRAIVTHLDTLGAMVKQLKPNGRLAVTPVGTWSSRFAEGARVSIFGDKKLFRGTILPLKASGHTYDDEVNTQPVDWDHVEIRVDEAVNNDEDLAALGLNVGDFIGVDAGTEMLPNGFINSRHLDDKAGVAAVLAAARHLHESGLKLATDLYLLFTISEEVGSGASGILHGDVTEMVSIDNGTVAPGQNSREFGVTLAMADSTGPFDFHLTHHLRHLCENHRIPYVRDIFKYYRCDSASAVESGNDIRTALVTFGVDGSHGYERTNLAALTNVAQLIVAYATQPPFYEAQANLISDLDAFPETRKVKLEAEMQDEPENIAQTPPPDHDAEPAPTQHATSGADGDKATASPRAATRARRGQQNQPVKNRT